jgi:hypothetical protein
MCIIAAEAVYDNSMTPCMSGELSWPTTFHCIYIICHLTMVHYVNLYGSNRSQWHAPAMAVLYNRMTVLLLCL